MNWECPECGTTEEQEERDEGRPICQECVVERDQIREMRRAS